MEKIAQRIADIEKHIPEGVKLVCVSKYHTKESILEAYNIGQRLFGESRVQELQAKAPELPQDIAWHFVGHLQTNKVKQVVPLVSMVHSVDSIRLLLELNNAAQQCGKTVNCLLQLHIAQESSKHGFTYQACEALLEEGEWRQLPYIRIRGLMGMSTLTDDQEVVKAEFTQLKTFFDKIKSCYFETDKNFDTLSMGMSDDYQDAIAAGSTLVRIGSGIFGERTT